MAERAERAVGQAMDVATYLDGIGEAKRAEDVRRVCRSNRAYRGTLQQLHRDNMRLRGGLEGESPVATQLKQPKVVMACCSDTECAHEWIVAYLPMPLDRAAMLMERAACPKCANERPVLAHD